MKRRILAIALAVNAGIILLTAVENTPAQNQLRPVADTGVIKVGSGQLLRVSLTGDFNPDEVVRVRFTKIGYEPCQASPKLCELSRTTSPAITLGSGEAVAIDWGDGAPDDQRIVVVSNNRNVRVTGMLIDRFTGETKSIIVNLIAL